MDDKEERITIDVAVLKTFPTKTKLAIYDEVQRCLDGPIKTILDEVG